MKKISLSEFTITELKKMVVDYFTNVEKIPYGEASRQVNKASFSIKGDTLVVVYENNEQDVFTSETVLIMKK